MPFCVLLTSTVMESNGSSSMATVCGGSLALMDAGVDIPSNAAGVAIGLVSKLGDEGEIQDYKILTDILGIEDYLGDMDFKLAGTKQGVTAIQADIKLMGVPIQIIMDSIDEGFRAKNSILNIMNEVISRPNRSKENLPVVKTKEIPSHKRGAIMAAGGIKLKRIQAESGVQITWEESNALSLFAPNQDSMDEALQCIEDCLQSEPQLEFGAIYTAKIIEIRPQGVMITLYDGMTPVLLHNSQLDVKKVAHPSALNLDVGEEIKVKYFGRDPTSGHMRLSRRALLSTFPSTKNLMRKGKENS
ncbi:UNVERIFIED_CONTAM: hypothetical protein GTU68_025129 [Idotea baltica]|nr:hypothetical protein [Idotea baltica]